MAIATGRSRANSGWTKSEITNIWETTAVHKNNLITFLIAILFSAGLFAQTVAAPSAKAKAPPKKVKIDYENDVITGSYDVPDAQFLNSRKLIKYKELFNKRTNFIEEIEANKGLFNEYQK